MVEARAAQTRQENLRLLDRYLDVQAPKEEQDDLPMPKFACACCGRNVGSPSLDLIELGVNLYCPRCRSHYELPGESSEREFERLRAHDADLRLYARRAWAAQFMYREKMKGAYRSRDAWRSTFAEVVLPHEPGEDGTCVTCHQPSPCSVWMAMKESNQGIFREVEKFGALSDEELEQALYPQRINDRDFGAFR